MDDYFKELEKYKDIKDIKDIIDEINKLNELYSSNRHEEMLEHIQSLMIKYLADTIRWNSVNKEMPQTIEQQYINANNFLRAQSAKILIEKGIKLSKVN